MMKIVQGDRRFVARARVRLRQCAASEHERSRAA
jgi:hypothetical protein